MRIHSEDSDRRDRAESGRGRRRTEEQEQRQGELRQLEILDSGQRRMESRRTQGGAGAGEEAPAECDAEAVKDAPATFRHRLCQPGDSIGGSEI